MVGVSKTHGQKTVLRDISLGFFYGAKIGVLGLNGAGKSTLLRIMAGTEESSNGEVGPTRSACSNRSPSSRSARQCLPGGRGRSRGGQGACSQEFDELADRFSEPMDDDEMQKVLDRQAEVQDKIEAMGAWELDSRLELAMDALRCPPPDTVVDTLSGGERRRVALCRLLIKQPDILLLDEPTNHLDALSVGWLERHLKEYPGTVIAVTHDRYFLDNVAGWILELDRGHGIPWRGNYSSWLEQKEERLRQEERSEGRRQKTLERELEWIRMAPRARHAKGKARISAFQDLLSQEPEQMVRDLEIWIPPGPRLGDVVIEAEGLSKAFGDRLLFDDLTFSVPPGAVVGIIGGNGAGKTTLFELITGGQESRIPAPFGSAIRCSSDTSTRAARPSTPKNRCGRSSPRARNRSGWAAPRSTRAPTSGASISRAPISRNRSSSCRAANATASTWRGCSRRAPTSCSSMSPPTISTSTRCERLKRRSSPLPAP